MKIKTIITSIIVALSVVQCKPTISNASSYDVKLKEPTKYINAKEYGGLTGKENDNPAKLQALFKKINKEYSKEMVELHFPEGVYVTDKRVTVYGNIVVSGESDKTVFKNINEKQNTTKAVFTNGEDGRTDYKGNAGSNIEFRDITFKNSLAISLGQGQNIIVNRVHVIDQPNAHAIEINACKNVLIKDCLFEGLNRGHTSEGMASRNYNEIIELDSSTKASYPYFGAWAEGNYQPINENIYIINNTFKPSKNHAYPVAVGAHGSWGNLKKGYKNVVIKGNIIDGATFRAITFPHAESLIIEDNTISNTPYGVRYVSTSKLLNTEKIVIKNNTFKNVDNGVLIGAYQTDKRIKNAVVTGNAFIGSNSSTKADNKNGSFGLKVEYTNNLTESKNTYKGFKNSKVLYKKAKVNCSGLNLRKSKTTSSKSLRVLPRNTIVQVESNSSNGWTKVSCNGLVGYVSSKYITTIK